MSIKWDNIFGFLALIFCIYLFSKMAPYINVFAEALTDGYYFYYDDPVVKILAIGIVCMTVIGIVKIISRR